jgi:flagellar biosynthesis chaperone FliJ
MLQNDRQLANTREKLRLLEESYEEVRQEAGGDEQLREAEMESLKRFINQLKEEIARYESRQPARR